MLERQGILVILATSFSNKGFFSLSIKLIGCSFLISLEGFFTLTSSRVRGFSIRYSEDFGEGDR